MPRPASEPDTIGPTTPRRAAPHLGRGLAALALVWIPALATPWPGPTVTDPT